MKKAALNLLINILGWQVRRLRRTADFKTVIVAGSIGKTSTKFAIAQLLSGRFRVRFQEGNYNHPVTVPLVFFGRETPPLYNPLAWLKILIGNELTLRRPYPYDVVVLELGTDGPGQLKDFARYLQADIGVLTAIAPEHMEFFGSLEAVAAEETSIVAYSDQLLINLDLCAEEYIGQLDNVIGYAQDQPAAYRVNNKRRTSGGLAFSISNADGQLVRLEHGAVAEVQLYSICAAVAVGDLLGMTASELAGSVKRIRPAAGRLQLLDGLNGSVILDDTYNASPAAVRAALDTVYAMKATRKIALLGNMNELGDHSEAAHKSIGEYCDPAQLELVVTLGPDANRYLAPAAEAGGCQVRTCQTPYEAAEIIKPLLTKGTLLLAKGSQNGVFAEEAVKQLLADPADADKLVRQSPAWLKKKEGAFSGGR